MYREELSKRASPDTSRVLGSHQNGYTLLRTCKGE